MKIIAIIGARPQFIKGAAISRILRNTPSISDSQSIATAIFNSLFSRGDDVMLYGGGQASEKIVKLLS